MKILLALFLMMAVAHVMADDPPSPPPPHVQTPGSGEIAHFVHLHGGHNILSSRDKLIKSIQECKPWDPDAPKPPVAELIAQVPDNPISSDTYIYSAKERSLTVAHHNYVLLMPNDCTLLRKQETKHTITSHRGRCNLKHKRKVAAGRGCDPKTPRVNFLPDKGHFKSIGKKTVLGHQCDLYFMGKPGRPSWTDTLVCQSHEGSFDGFTSTRSVPLKRGLPLSLTSEKQYSTARAIQFDMPVSESLFEIPKGYKILQRYQKELDEEGVDSDEVNRRDDD